MSDTSFLADGTPQKRLFRSIIADYDLQSSICELIDNAIDHWSARGRAAKLEVRVFINLDRQLIAIHDNAGGVPKSDIELLIAPGASRGEEGVNFIGNFGVGGKRAGIHLGQRVEVTTRFEDQETHRFVLSDEWLSEDTWDVQVDQVADIEVGNTKVSISSLRQGFSNSDVQSLIRNLEEIYSEFVGDTCSIRVNGSDIGRSNFDNWAYPPDHRPKKSEFRIFPDDENEVLVRLEAGLIQDRDPIEENYGVYFYCNDRLILAHERSYEIGFFKGEAGVPHPDASLARTIVHLKGPPELMPWTSNKNGINWSHPTFAAIRDRIIALNTHFVKVSRRMKNVRDEQVFAFQTGEVEAINLEADDSLKRVVDLPLPRARRRSYLDLLNEANAQVMAQKPWTVGLVEAMSTVDYLSRKKFETRNRQALILLDSNLEIGLKEFIVHRADLFRPDKFGDAQLLELFKKRHEVINKVKPHLTVDDTIWNKVRHYYDRRNKLIHERATLQITDRELEDYRVVVEDVLSELFDLSFRFE